MVSCVRGHCDSQGWLFERGLVTVFPAERQAASTKPFRAFSCQLSDVILRVTCDGLQCLQSIRAVSVNACIRLAKIVGGFNSLTDLSSLSVLHGRFPTKLTNCLQKGGRKLDVLEKSQHAQPVHVFSKYAAILEAMARSRECKKMVVAWYALAARIGAEICLT